jgi:hypothetical protein
MMCVLLAPFQKVYQYQYIVNVDSRYDEKSGKNGRVPECLAIHTESSQKVYVEAKTRNVTNVLGSTPT